MSEHPTDREYEALALDVARRHGLDPAVCEAKLRRAVETSRLMRLYARLALWLDRRMTNPKYSER